MADPLLQGHYPTRGLYQALAVAAMCLQEQAATRPLIGDVVTALSYLASQSFDPNTANTQPPTPKSRAGSGNINSPHGNSPDHRQKDPVKRVNRSAKVGRDGSGSGSGRNWGLEELEAQDSRMDSPVHVGRARESLKNFDPDHRERAVAEAKEWSENWRERQRKHQPGSFDRTHE